MSESLREQRGRRVREVWVRWAAEQPDPKDSWLTPWEDLDEGQREVDMRIGEALAADEQERIRHALLNCRACGRIHVPLPPAFPLQAPNWASPDDGHSYSPAWVWMRGDLGSIVSAVLNGDSGE